MGFCQHPAEILSSNNGWCFHNLQIPAGVSRYFDVTGTIAGATSGASVSTQVEGDAAYPQLATLMVSYLTVENDAGSHNDFIWSPNATTTTVISVVDWAIGYGVSGLPSSQLDRGSSIQVI